MITKLWYLRFYSIFPLIEISDCEWRRFHINWTSIKRPRFTYPIGNLLVHFWLYMYIEHMHNKLYQWVWIFLGKTVNSTCRTSQECYGKLVCIKGTCHCSEQLYWDGTNCVMRKLTKHFKTIIVSTHFSRKHKVIDIIYFIIQIP